MGPIKALISFLGRALLASLFLASAGMNHIPKFEEVTTAMANKGVPEARNVHYAAIGCMLVGGTLLLVGLFGRVGAFLLAGFLIGATYYMHNFWTMEAGPARDAEMFHLMTNATILGGLLFVLANGSGAGAIDRQRVVVTAAE
jgi:putative oxidoreductase